MKTTKQIALEVANTSFVDRRNNIMPTSTFMGNDDELLTFTKRLIEAWLEQQSQEPVAYMAPSGTCVTAEDVSYTPNWTDYYTIPLYAAPPAKVEQHSQEPVAWMGRDGEDFSYKESSYFTQPLFLAPQLVIPEGMCLVPKEPSEAMCAVITNDHDVYATPEALYEALLEAAQGEQQ